MIKIRKSASNISVYSCQPKTKEELEVIIDKRIKKEGPNCDLNDIDVSLIDDMSWLFHGSDFNGDISKWDVSNVEDMYNMFGCSKFNGDISRWNVSNVRDTQMMFNKSRFNQDISNWDTRSLRYAWCMFNESIFNQDISSWNIRKDCDVEDMFLYSHTKEEYKPKSLQKK